MVEWRTILIQLKNTGQNGEGMEHVGRHHANSSFHGSTVYYISWKILKAHGMHLGGITKKGEPRK